uniref:ATP-binding cassette sub-family D member 3 n=1 Tax=Myodes glareolus TaxID=447135 RepID=UPI00202169B5|nr:ATP-binding cassette sub-family D member 3 [Myodes glareolus]
MAKGPGSLSRRRRPAWPALPGLVKARVCARGAHKTGTVGARDQRRGHAAGTRRVYPLHESFLIPFFINALFRFDHVPLATPNGDILIRDLSFEVRSGANVLICGPNGCGKSSLFRVLGELWPLFGGRLTKPERGKLFYVPQRPYMTLGTLRDQVIYPDGKEDQKKKGISDQVLKEYLDNVQLGHILEREGGWDSVQDWMDVLSGGEKQRMAMARLFYHKPQFAILDECTSAVSVDVEDYIYSHCRKVGITLFTVSHRKSLWKHHEYYLHMDGRGNYEFKKITEDTVEFGS